MIPLSLLRATAHYNSLVMEKEQRQKKNVKWDPTTGGYCCQKLYAVFWFNMLCIFTWRGDCHHFRESALGDLLLLAVCKEIFTWQACSFRVPKLTPLGLETLPTLWGPKAVQECRCEAAKNTDPKKDGTWGPPTEDSLGTLKAIQMEGRALKQGETGGFC